MTRLPRGKSKETTHAYDDRSKPCYIEGCGRQWAEQGVAAGAGEGKLDAPVSCGSRGKKEEMRHCPPPRVLSPRGGERRCGIAHPCWEG